MRLNDIDTIIDMLQRIKHGGKLHILMRRNGDDLPTWGPHKGGNINFTLDMDRYRVVGGDVPAVDEDNAPLKHKAVWAVYSNITLRLATGHIFDRKVAADYWIAKQPYNDSLFACPMIVPTGE